MGEWVVSTTAVRCADETLRAGLAAGLGAVGIPVLPQHPPRSWT
jgi:hypothetical protein